jgi:hypothetical protein
VLAEVCLAMVAPIMKTYGEGVSALEDQGQERERERGRERE